MLRELSGLVPRCGGAKELMGDWSARDDGRIAEGQRTSMESQVSTGGREETYRKDDGDTAPHGL